MSHRVYIAVAFILAIVATVVGWSQTMVYKITPPVPFALWFPLVVITRTSDLEAVAVSLIQFPLFATTFALAIGRWPVARVIGVLALTYALLAGLALAILRSR